MFEERCDIVFFAHCSVMLNLRTPAMPTIRIPRSWKNKDGTLKGTTCSKPPGWPPTRTAKGVVSSVSIPRWTPYLGSGTHAVTI